MDPYLEARWNDVLTALCTEIRAALQPNLPNGLRARAQEDVVLEAVDGEKLQSFEADTAIIQTRGFTGATAGAAAISTAPPVRVKHLQRLIRNRWVELIDTTAGNKVITAIEILSPGNKASGKLNRRYRKKLLHYIEAGVNIVEIDLLRSSRKRLEIKVEELPPERRAEYMTCIQRATEEDEWDVYPMPQRQPLPVIPIPCRATDADVPLALQPIIEQIYVEGGHDDIDYSKPADPPLKEDQAAWARAIAL